MKRWLVPWTLSLVFLVSCVPATVKEYHPIVKTRAELQAQVGVTPVAPAGTTGKIVLSPDRTRLLVGKKDLGWSVVDVSDPAKPVARGFFTVPGSRDALLFLQGGQLWLVADAYRDLVLFRVSLGTELSIIEAARINNRFYRSPDEVLNEKGVYAHFSDPIPEGAVAVGFTTSSHIEFQSFPMGGAEGVALGAQAGAVGSLARFALPEVTGGRYLYTVDLFSLGVVDLLHPAEPLPVTTLTLGWDIETIFSYGSNLYIGSSSAMYLYGLQNPEQPVQQGVLGHVVARDPVVVGPVGPDKVDTAFVTLHGSWAGSNLLYAYNVAVPSQSVELWPGGFSMNRPQGLGFVAPDRLLVCEGGDGFRVLDVSGVYSGFPQRLATVYDPSFEFTDVIPGQTVHILVGPQGVRFYTYQDPSGSNADTLTLVGELQL